MLAAQKHIMRKNKDMIHRFISLLIGLRIFTIPRGDRSICPSRKVTFAAAKFHHLRWDLSIYPKTDFS